MNGWGLGGLGLWVRSEWRHTWRALALIAVIVALGGGLTMAAVAGARRVSSAFGRFTDATHTSLMVSSYSAMDPSIGESSLFPLAADVAGLDGVDGVTPLAWIGAGLDAPGLDTALFAAVTGTTEGPEPPTIAALFEGRRPDPEVDDEVMINAEAARLSGLAVGDTVTARTLSPAQHDLFLSGDRPDEPGGPSFEVEVVGIYRAVEDITDIPEAFVFFSPGLLERHGEEIAHCECGLFVNAEADRMAAITETIESTPLNLPLVVEDANAAALSRITQAVAVESNTLWIAAAIAGIAALLIAGQAVDRHLGERRRAWSSLSALGSVRSQVVAAWFVVMAPVLIVGAAAASVLAVAMSGVFPRGIARTAEPEPGVLVDPLALAGGVLVLLVIMSALVVAVTLVRTSRRTGHARRPFIVAWLRNAPAPVALGAGFAIDPARDRRGVAALSGVIGLGLAVAGVTAVALVDSSIDDLLASPRAYAADWDLEMAQQPDDVPDTMRRTLAEPAVDGVALAWQAGGVSFAIRHGDSVTTEWATALENVQGSIGPTIAAGRPVARTEEVALGRATAADLDVEVGDEVTFTSRAGVAEPYVVSGIGRLADDEDSDRFALMTIDGLTRLQPELDLSGAYVRMSAMDPAAIDRLHRLGWTDVRAPAKSANLGQIGDVPALLAFALCALGLAGVVNALLVALRRRRDDLAITRAIGFTRHQSAATMRWQGIVTALLAVAVGVPIGLVVGRSIWRLLATGAGVTDLVTIPWRAVVVAPIVVVAAVTTIAAIAGRRAADVRAAAVLRTE